MFLFPVLCLLAVLEQTVSRTSDVNVIVDYGPGLGSVSSVRFDPLSSLYYVPESLNEIQPKFYLYTKANGNGNPLITLDYLNNQSLDTTLLDTSKMTYFLIHGWPESGFKKTYIDMKNLLLDKLDCNVIVADYPRGVPFNVTPYQGSVNIFVVARVAFRLVQLLHDRRGLDLDKLHIIGFSLGGQISGMIGRSAISKMNKTVGRISAMDPAGQWYRDHPEECISKADAQFVDVIHTNAKDSETPYGVLNFGLKKPAGHVDFYVNGGREQPPCQNNETLSEIELSGGMPTICNHLIAVLYYTESLKNNCNFTSYPCPAVVTSDSAEDWAKCNNCGDKNCGRMGFYSNLATGRGPQYLTTNQNSPFCKG